MHGFRRAALCAASALALASQAGAAVLVDREPVDAPIRSLSNILSNFNFFVELNVTGTVNVTGFGVWTDPRGPFIGQGVSLALAPDASGLPDVADLTRYSSTISEIDPRPGFGDVLAIANFSPITLTTGIYWIGMSGADTDLGWNLYTLEGVSTPSNEAFLKPPSAFCFTYAAETPRSESWETDPAQLLSCRHSVLSGLVLSPLHGR